MATTGPKRSLFNKPSWASTSATNTSDTNRPVFGNRLYDDIVEAEKRRKEKEGPQTKARAEKDTGREAKRRRISEEGSGSGRETLPLTKKYGEEGVDSGSDTEWRPTPTTPRGKHRSDMAKRQQSPDSNVSPRKSKHTRAIVIDLGDDERQGSEEASLRPTSKVAKGTPTKKQIPKVLPLDPVSDDEDEDDYTRELKQRAREKARFQKLGIGIEKTGTSKPPSGQDDKLSSLPPSHPLIGSSNVNTSASKLPTPEDPLCRIMINTNIPNTRPLIVNRRASQSLQHVREFWCKRQGFNEAQTAKVFLTWRGTKLFNASTLAPLLRRLKEERPMEVFTMEADQGEGGVPEGSGGGIELEAMTEEILQEYNRNRERKAMAAVSPGIGENDEERLAASPGRNKEEGSTAQPRQDGIIIQLVCQGLPSLNLRVRPNTEIRKLMAGFKKTRDVDANKTCWLVFDGERLEPDQTVENVGLEAEDTVEVHLR